MSLVPSNYTNNWSIVLRDNAKKAVVLYDPASKKLSLVNDPSLFRRIQSLDSRFLLEDNRDTPICSHCGQFITQTRDQRRAERRVDGAGNSSAAVVRNVDYFELLDSAASSNEPGYPGLTPTTHGISEDAFSQGYFDRFFETKSMLGRGSRGAVYLVEHFLDGVSLGLFALKKVPVGDNHEWLEKVLAEVQMLRILSHPNLVSYNHVWLESSSISTFAPKVPCAFILQEYCNGGTLEDYIRAKVASAWGSSKRDRIRRQSRGAFDNDSVISSNQMLSIDEIMSFMQDIVSGVIYLHQNQIIHRDLKPSNCLLINSPIPERLPTVLVSDFGEGQLEGTYRSETGSTGTLEYCAPELVTPHDGRLGQFSKKTDIFSLGMILYYLCFSRLPYSKGVWDELEDIDLLKSEVQHFVGFDQSKTKLLRSDLPPELYGLLSSMLQPVPQDRPTGEQVLEQLQKVTGTRQSPAIVEEDVEQSQSSMQLVPRGSSIVPQTGIRIEPIQLVPLTRSAIVAAELAVVYFMKHSVLTQIAVLLIGMQIPMQSTRFWYLVLAFIALSMYTTI